MKDRLEVIQARYDQISKDLLDINIVSDIKKMTALSKEQRSLEKTVEKYQALLACEKNISDLKELSHDSDPDIREMAEMELSEAQELLSTLTDEIKILLIPKDPNDDKNVVMEIRGAAGGDEANIFAGDLYRMYIKYAESKGWSHEVINEVKGTSGGYSQVEFMK